MVLTVLLPSRKYWVRAGSELPSGQDVHCGGGSGHAGGVRENPLEAGGGQVQAEHVRVHN